MIDALRQSLGSAPLVAEKVILHERKLDGVVEAKLAAYLTFMRNAANRIADPHHFEWQIHQEAGITGASLDNELQVANVWLSTIEPSLSSIIRLIE